MVVGVAGHEKDAIVISEDVSPGNDPDHRSEAKEQEEWAKMARLVAFATDAFCLIRARPLALGV
jgi:hypothetical protein